MFVPVNEFSPDAVIKVIGVGGGGGNAVNRMASDEISGVEFFNVNTDAQVLRTSPVRNTIQIGEQITKGLGAGSKPEIGRDSAEEDRDALTKMLSGADMTFIAAGMGGGTGTGAAPVIAQIAKELGSLTVAIVTKPFRFEGPKRMRQAEQGIHELSKHVDSLIIIPNDKLKSLGKNTSMVDAFAAANDVLRNAVIGITNMITSAGGATGADINVDFADVRTVMSEMGHAMIGTGFAEGEVGEGRAEKAMQEAAASPLLENIDLSGARGMLVSVTAGTDFLLDEGTTMMEYIYGFAGEDATIVFGCTFSPEMNGKVSVTLVATGLGNVEEADMPKLKPNPVPTRLSYSPYEGNYETSSIRDANPHNGGSSEPTVSNTHDPFSSRIEGSKVYQPVPRFLRRDG